MNVKNSLVGIIGLTVLLVSTFSFTGVDGKLYVSKSLYVYDTWPEEKAANIETANGKWSTIKDIAAKDL